MRLLIRIALIALAPLLPSGCRSGKSYDGPTVDAFTGRLVADGKPVSFPPGEKVQLGVTHHASAREWWIPIQTDGTFKIGWMPIGKYTAMLKRPSNAPARQGGGRPSLYTVPTTFEIVDGKTDYTIDLGKEYKP
jgi:hypothetical protein